MLIMLATTRLTASGLSKGDHLVDHGYSLRACSRAPDEGMSVIGAALWESSPYNAAE